MRLTRLWISLTLVFVISFAILGYYGGEIYQTMPPIPKRVVTSTGIVLFTDKEIKEGQNVWQSIGGQELGSVWGHGAYVAPDWNADWLHREAMWFLDKYAADQFGKSYDKLDDESKAML
jgi:nitric oxide reductase subunit B